MTLFFISIVVQWVAVIIFCIAASIIIMRDSYCKRMSLSQSLEDAKIDTLLKEGKISQEEASSLKSQCASLASTRISTPLPDLPLKIAAILTVVYSGGSAILLVLRILSIRALALDMSGGHMYVKENLWILAIICGFFIILNIFLLISGFLFIRGSLKWRTTAVILFLAAILIHVTSIPWTVLSCAAFIFVTYVLLLRENASNKIFANAPHRSLSWRAMCGLIIFIALAAGFAIRPITITYAVKSTYNYENINKSSRNSYFGPFNARLKNIYILESSDSPELKAFTRTFADELAKLEPSLNIVAVTEKSLPMTSFTPENSICFFTDISYEKPGKKSAELNFLLKSIKKEDNLYMPSEFAFPKGHYVISFEMVKEFHSRRNSFQYNGKSFYLPGIGISFSLNYNFVSSNPLETAQKIGKQSALEFVKAFERALSSAAVEYPVLPRITPSIPELAIPALDSFRTVYWTSEPNNATSALYSFKSENEEKSIAIINAEIEKLGFDKLESAEYLYGKSSYKTSIPKTTSECAVYFKSGTGYIALYGKDEITMPFEKFFASPEEAAKYLADFKAQYPNSFLMTRAITTLDETTKKEMLKPFALNKNIPIENRIETMEFPGIELETALELAAEISNIENGFSKSKMANLFMSRLQRCDSYNAVLEYLKDKNPNFIIEISSSEADFDEETKNAVYQFIFKADELADTGKVILISIPPYKTYITNIGLEILENGNKNLRLSGTSIQLSEDSRDSTGIYNSLDSSYDNTLRPAIQGSYSNGNNTDWIKSKTVVTLSQTDNPDEFRFILKVFGKND